MPIARLAVMAAAGLAVSASAQEPTRDERILRCIALIDVVAELEINDPVLERQIRALFVEELQDKTLLSRLEGEKEYLVENIGEWGGAADPYGCGEWPERWYREGRLTLSE